MIHIPDIHRIHSQKACDERQGEEDDSDDCKDEDGDVLVFAFELNELDGLNAEVVDLGAELFDGTLGHDFGVVHDRFEDSVATAEVTVTIVWTDSMPFDEPRETFAVDVADDVELFHDIVEVLKETATGVFLYFELL